MSGGILGGGYPQGAGILGGSPQPAGMGILDRVGQAFADNAGMLMGYGSGGFDGAMQGMVQDERTRLIKQKQAEEEQKKVAARQLAQKMGRPELAEFPDLAGQLYVAQNTPKEVSLDKQIWNSLSDPQKQEYVQNNYLRPKGDPSLTSQMAQRAQGAAALGITPNDPAFKPFVLTGKLPGEDNKVMAGDRKVIYGAEDENLNLDNTISTLTEAEKLNTKTFTGTGSEMWGRLGTSGLPGTGYIDQDKAKATAEFGKIMSFEAIKTMAETLKGATTDNELNKFVEILADPNTPPEIRGRTIQRMKTLAERKRQLNNERINEISGGTYFKNRANGGRGDNPSAQDAITVDGYTIRQR